MGNRYTRTTLTNRQRDTLEGCRRKIRKILFDRVNLDSPNEAQKPIDLLRSIIIQLDRLDISIQDEREAINRGE